MRCAKRTRSGWARVSWAPLEQEATSCSDTMPIFGLLARSLAKRGDRLDRPEGIVA